MATKKKAQKRKRISKHILKAQERQKEEQEGDTEKANVDATTTTRTPKKKKRVPNSKVKDPKDVQEYLSNWKHREQGSGSIWKFNKNTQSWMFRHMYDSNKIPKATFTILLEYIGGLKGSTCDWVKQEATRKALRYKEWEKRNTNKEGEEEIAKKTEEENQNDNDEEQKEDDKRFMSLSDHDKRKEYKRCRKVLDQMKMMESSN
jgi:hypothetical protein